MRGRHSKSGQAVRRKHRGQRPHPTRMRSGRIDSEVLGLNDIPPPVGPRRGQLREITGRANRARLDPEGCTPIRGAEPSDLFLAMENS